MWQQTSDVEQVRLVINKTQILQLRMARLPEKRRYATLAQQGTPVFEDDELFLDCGSFNQ